MDSQRINDQAMSRDERQRRREISKQSLGTSASEGGEMPTSEGDGIDGTETQSVTNDKSEGAIEVKATLAEIPKNSDSNEVFCMEAVGLKEE